MSTLYLTLVCALINFIWILNNWTISIFITIPFILHIINYKNSPIFHPTRKNRYKNKNYFRLFLFLIFFSCLISAFIHSLPSFTQFYPLGFDTYRLHIIRINYIIENGKLLLGDLITPDFLNPLRYQWGFHLFTGSIGIMINQNAIFILRILPLVFSLLFPLSIYTASPLFGLKNLRARTLSCILSPLFLFDPTIHGLVYPFPSSMALILFTISLRFFYEIIKGKKKLVIFIIFIIPVFFFLYKGLGIIFALITIISLPILLVNYYSENKSILLKKFYLLMIITIILSIFLTINLIIFLENLSSFSFSTFFEDYLYLVGNSFQFELNILEIYKIAGIISSILFFISIFIIRYYFLNKSNKYSVLVISIFVSVFI
ncbi:MAG: hypothetical protein ACFFEY_15700, partial [Candidatus Thorarchaeota archaeon]